MKTMKRMAGVLLALVMALALTVPAFAAGETYTITINNTNPGHTYEAYQIFTGRLEGDVLSDIEWGSGVNTTGLIADLKGISALSGLANDATAADVAEKLSGSEDDSDLAKAFAAAIGGHLSGTKVESSEKTSTVDGKTVTTGYSISGLSAGYYLVKDKEDTQKGDYDTYTRYILEVVKNVQVQHKGTVPTVEKAVNDANTNIGDTVTFTLTATMPSDITGYEKYKLVFHDTLSKGLTYGQITEVKVGSTPVGTGYVPATEAAANGETKLTITFDDVIAQGAKAGDKIVVKYTATVNSDAVIGGAGNPNTVTLEYSNDPNFTGDGNPPTGVTPPAEVLVFTYELDVTKVDGKDNSKTLKGAEFVLYRENNGKTEYVQLDNANKVTGWTETKGDATTLTSGADGLFKVIGLEAGAYKLEETKAPTGYNMLESAIELTITATTDASGVKTLTITVGSKTENGTPSTGIVTTSVENNAGATLPSTGGIGTTIFYVLGGALMLGAVVLLVTKKRMNAE